MKDARTSRGQHLWRIWVFIVVAVALSGSGTPAHAFPQAATPTQSIGNRGADVVALQHLLTAHGRSETADGVFGSGTESSVRAFQRTEGLGVDGIVGPSTWAKLFVTVRAGDSGPAVKGVQSLLNAKQGAGLAVEGDLNAATTAAVKAFQTHGGLASDGIVGPDTWKNLLWHYEFAAFLSGGGLWPVRTDSAQCTGSRITWQSAAYDRAATRSLVQAVRAAAHGHVTFVLFNDPQLISEGLTTQYAGHDNHLHIRYCEKVYPSRSYVC